MPKAEKVFEERREFDDGAFIVIRVWSVPEPVPPSPHGFKYSFFYGRPGERLVLFDNERGKGDHKHIREVESSHRFVSVERLVEDFLAAVSAMREEGEGE